MENQVETNKANVKNALNAGLKLTVLSAVKLGTIDLRKYVSILKREGMDIISEPTQNENKKRFNTYYLRK